MSFEEHINYLQTVGKTGSEAVAHLNALVKALDRAFISTWQSTAGWKMELDQAREWLAHQNNKENQE